MINHSFYLGAGGYGLVTAVNTLGPGADTSRIDIGYGGGSMFVPDELVHLGIQMLVGAGGVGYRSYHDEDRFGNYTNSDGFFVVEPSVVGELNILRNIGLAIGASYRFINGIETAG